MSAARTRRLALFFAVVVSALACGAMLTVSASRGVGFDGAGVAAVMFALAALFALVALIRANR